MHLEQMGSSEAALSRSAVEADEEVIVHPANEIADGTRVQPREQKTLSPTVKVSRDLGGG